MRHFLRLSCCPVAMAKISMAAKRACTLPSLHARSSAKQSFASWAETNLAPATSTPAEGNA